MEIASCCHKDFLYRPISETINDEEHNHSNNVDCRVCLTILTIHSNII